MGREIAVNSNTLKNEVETMRKALQQLKTRIDESFTAIRELNDMWDGSASMTFLLEFAADHQELIKTCESIEALISSMDLSRLEYEKCEADVKSITDSLKI